MAVIASTRKKQFVLKADSGSFPSGAFTASDAIPVTIDVDFNPELEKYDIDVARKEIWKNEGLIGGAKNKAVAKTFLIGPQPSGVWSTNFTDTILKACALSATALTRIEVTASNALIKRGDSVSVVSPAFTGTLVHNKTLSIGGKHYIFVKSTTGTNPTASASISVGAQSLTAQSGTPSAVWGVEYSQNHSAQTTYSSALWSDGLVQRMYGALSNLKIDFEPSKVGMIQMDIAGIYTPDTALAGDLTAMGLPISSITFPSANSAPKAKNSAITIGSTTAREFRKVTLDFGIKPEIRPDISAVDGYQPAICLESEPKITIEMATSVSNMASDRALLVAGTPFQSIDGLIGNTLGNAFYFYGDNCQLFDDTDGDGNKVMTNSQTYNAVNGIVLLSI